MALVALTAHRNKGSTGVLTNQYPPWWPIVHRRSPFKVTRLNPITQRSLVGQTLTTHDESADPGGAQFTIADRLALT